MIKLVDLVPEEPTEVLNETPNGWKYREESRKLIPELRDDINAVFDAIELLTKTGAGNIEYKNPKKVIRLLKDMGKSAKTLKQEIGRLRYFDYRIGGTGEYFPDPSQRSKFNKAIDKLNDKIDKILGLDSVIDIY